MVAFQYRKETPMFKMLFDKKFRFERYNEILSNKKKFKNKSQFKSYIFTNFNQFDISWTEYMEFFTAFKTMQKSKLKIGDIEELKVNDEAEKSKNILLENKYLSYYSGIYKIEQVAKLSLLSLVAYIFLCIPFNILHQKALIAIVSPGMLWTGISIHARTIKKRDYEMKILPLYVQEYKKYEEFFVEEGYDE